MDAPGQSPFGVLLRHFRLAAGLSQEALAERARLSARAISDLERGARRHPYPGTVRQLADALGLVAADRARLETAAQHRRGLPRARPTAPAPGDPPVPATTFIGREREQAAIRRLLQTARLLTLTGTGGIGKTRLALQVARAVGGRYRDGVRLVDFSALPSAGSDPRGPQGGPLDESASPQAAYDAALVPARVAAAFGVREQPGRSALDALVETLAGRELLLVLDNCEHLRAACAACVDTLLHACPSLRILATSREPLGVATETVWRVPPLALPEPDYRSWYPDTDAVRLFVERATAALPVFALTRENAAAVAYVCRRLDGIPLAIELAAARVKILTVEQIAARLEERFRLLTGGDPAALPRHQTLRATLDWSYDLLTAPERRLCERLGLFAGGCTLEAAEAVCTDDVVAPAAFFDLLTSLVDKSLVVVEHGGHAARYHMLDTVRQYALERLAESADDAASRERHLAYYTALVEETAPRLAGPAQGESLAQLRGELDNFRAALAFARARGWPPLGARLVYGLWQVWFLDGRMSEARRWLGEALATPTLPPRLRANLLNAVGALAHSQGDLEAARTALEESLDLCRQLDDRRGMAGALSTLGLVFHARGAFARAMELTEAAMALYEQLAVPDAVARMLNNLAAQATDAGDFARAEGYYARSLALKRRLGDRQGIALTLHNLAENVRLQGDGERAAALLEEALSVWRALGVKQRLAGSLHSLALVHIARGDTDRAATLLAESLALFEELEVRSGVALCLEGLAALAARRGHHRDAARLLGAAEAVREGIGVPVPAVERAAQERVAAAARAALGDDAFASAWAMGRAQGADAATGPADAARPT